MRTIFTVWCEWDIGLEHQAFTTEAAAWKAAAAALRDSSIEEPIKELEDEGLIGLNPVDLHE